MIFGDWDNDGDRDSFDYAIDPFFTEDNPDSDSDSGDYDSGDSYSYSYDSSGED